MGKGCWEGGGLMGWLGGTWRGEGRKEGKGN